MPPMVQFMCVAGSGPKRSPVGASSLLSMSSTIPGCTRQVRASVSTDSTWWQYLDQSITTASFVHCPARLVPPPRDSSGTS